MAIFFSPIPLSLTTSPFSFQFTRTTPSLILLNVFPNYLSLYLPTGLPVFLSLCVFFFTGHFFHFSSYTFSSLILFLALPLLLLLLCFIFVCASYVFARIYFVSDIFPFFRWIVNCYCIWELRKCAFMLNESTHKHIHTHAHTAIRSTNNLPYSMLHGITNK